MEDCSSFLTRLLDDDCQIPGVPYVFVHESHPVINLLRINKHIVGVDVDDQPKMDGQWHKITQSLFDSSCDTIKTRILTKIRTHDLNELNVSFDQCGWFYYAQHNLSIIILLVADPSHLLPMSKTFSNGIFSRAISIFTFPIFLTD